MLLLNASILFLVASMIGMAIMLSFGNPAKVFADIKASLTDISALRPDTVQSTPTIQSTADAKALPTARGVLTRDEIATTFDTADQSQAGISDAPSGALLNPAATITPTIWLASEGLEDRFDFADVTRVNRGQLEGR